MFARSALRAASKPTAAASPFIQRFAYATAATSHPAHFSAQAVEQANPHGMEISKAQRIAEDGFWSGTTFSPPRVRLIKWPKQAMVRLIGH